MTNGRSFAWVARRVAPEAAARVKALGIKGIYSQKEFERFYPDNQIAAQMLGYVGIDDNGLGELELKFEPELHGVPGRMYTAMDARRKVLGSSEHEPEPGQNMVLTIDENVQFIAERALDHVMEENAMADTGTVVVQDVHTGQILALASRPPFNPHAARKTPPALLKTHAVSDVYEPGSVFKLVTYSAALDQHQTSPDDMIDCQGGQITLFGRVIHDNQGEHYGVIPVHQALEVSSDVAAVKLALKVGPDKFYDYIREFGFGARTGVELPGETRGLLRPVNKMRRLVDRLAGYWTGGWRCAGAVGLDGFGHRQRGTYLPPHVLLPAPARGRMQEALQPEPLSPRLICPIRCQPVRTE